MSPEQGPQICVLSHHHVRKHCVIIVSRNLPQVCSQHELRAAHWNSSACSQRIEPEHSPLSIHELIDKKVWKHDLSAVSEAQKEAQGLIDAGTWGYKNVIPRHELERQARQSGTKVAIGRLMTIMIWKNAESATEKRLKARIVFLGNNVKDEFGLACELQEIKIIPTPIAGLNINLACGLRSWNKTSQSDVIKAYCKFKVTFAQCMTRTLSFQMNWSQIQIISNGYTYRAPSCTNHCTGTLNWGALGFEVQIYIYNVSHGWSENLQNSLPISSSKSGTCWLLHTLVVL